MKIELKYKSSQILLIITITILISIVSGIHRFLISLLSNATMSSSSNIYNSIETSVTLITWLGLVITIIPFGLAKGVTDYYAGYMKHKKKMLQLSSGLYLGGIGVIILSLWVSSIELKYIFLPISSGLIGGGEGLFLATAQILLSNYTSGSTRGRYLGFSEFSFYSGYTIGSLVAGILATNLDFSLAYTVALALVFLTIVLLNNVISYPSEPKKSQLLTEFPLKQKNLTEGELKSNNINIEDKINFHPMKLLKNVRILLILIGSHLSKWGDALIFLIPIYFAYLFSSNGTKIIPDTVRIGFILGMYTASWAVGMFITSYLTEYLGRKVPILIGLLVAGSGFLFLSILTKITPNLYSYTILAMFMAGFGTGLYYPLLPAVGLDIAKPKYQGQTLALFRTFRDLGYFTGPIGLIFLVYISGSTIQSMNVGISFVGLLMICIGGIFLLVLRETRPIWPFYHEFEDQMKLIREVVKQSINVFRIELLDQDEELKRLVSGAKILEEKADRKKRQLYKDIIVPMRKKDDKSDFVNLVELSDKISNNTAMAALKYSKLRTMLPNIPKPVLDALRKLASNLPPMMDELLESIKLLNERVSSVAKRQKIISQSEKNVDSLYDEFLQLMYQFEPFYQETEKFTIMMTLKETSELLEKSSDLILNIEDTLSMIAWKHKL